jgi:hypothetical protein
LMAKERGSLNELEKSELRDLLSIRITPLTSGT